MSTPHLTLPATGAATSAGVDAARVVSPFERDIAGQAGALRDFAQAPSSAGLAGLTLGDFDRIVLTGMGSSYIAALPTWRRLVVAGSPAWWVDSGQLLETPQLVTSRTLLIICSQSGASGEVVALLDRVDSTPERATIVGISNDPESPLGARADALVALHSGLEATVSTKSYLNTLTAYDHLEAALSGSALSAATSATEELAEAVERLERPEVLDGIAAEFVARSDARLAFVGFGDQAATALYAGLITKEAAKVAAEGFVGGEFRHGPLELSGPGLTAVLFTGEDPTSQQPLRQLAADLLESGSTVIGVGPLDISATVSVPTSARAGTPLLTQSAIVAQHLAVAVARAAGIEPGAFRYGSKITTTL
ncbi:hypothetical protein BH10ACT8_BH10ACT8_09200 [soil metagenome]